MSYGNTGNATRLVPQGTWPYVAETYKSLERQYFQTACFDSNVFLPGSGQAADVFVAASHRSSQSHEIFHFTTALKNKGTDVLACLLDDYHLSFEENYTRPTLEVYDMRRSVDDMDLTGAQLNLAGFLGFQRQYGMGTPSDREKLNFGRIINDFSAFVITNALEQT
jgi:hypothetical protein